MKKLTKQQIVLIVLMSFATILTILLSLFNLHILFAHTIPGMQWLLTEFGSIDAYTNFLLAGDIVTIFTIWILYGIAMWLLATKLIKSFQQ